MGPKKMKIILATQNSHKACELTAMLGLGIPVQTLGDLGFRGSIEEDGETFEANAGRKLHFALDYLRKNPGNENLKDLCVVADDSGLEVDGLKGAPGVYSARYAGEGANDLENLLKLLGEMKGIPGSKRTARFRCMLAAEFPDPGQKTHFFEGVVEGKIGFESKGKNGFGYDPIFFPLGSCRTFGEYSPDEKNQISHRFQAAGKLRAWLKTLNDSATINRRS